MSQFDYLDAVAREVARDNLDRFEPLSTGERLYAALAANRIDLVNGDGYTVVQALDRLGEDWTHQLMQRWKYVSVAQLRGEKPRP